MTMAVLAGASSGGNLLAVTPYVTTGSAQTIITQQNLAAGSWLWGKRTDNSSDHYVYDTARDSGSKYLIPNTTGEQIGESPPNTLTATGVTLSTGSNINNSAGIANVLFTWLKQAGYMDIVLDDGTGVTKTVSHNLGAPVQMMIRKERDGSGQWIVYHSSLGNTKFCILNLTSSAATSSSYWNNTSPTSTEFTVGNAADVNSAVGSFSGRYVTYLFAEKAGKSKFGSYTGTGASNAITGTGFTPRMVIIKRTNSVGDWMIAYNNGTSIVMLKANATDGAFNKSGYIDTFDSNGFTVLTDTSVNASGSTYIYAAWG